MKRMGLVALMALLCLPMGALAVREGVIEDAPMVEARRKTSYLPMHRVVGEETGKIAVVGHNAVIPAGDKVAAGVQVDASAQQ